MQQIPRVLGRDGGVIGIALHLAFKALARVQRLIDGGDLRRRGVRVRQRHHDVLDPPVAIRDVIGLPAAQKHLLLEQGDVVFIARPIDGYILLLVIILHLLIGHGDIPAVQGDEPLVFQRQLRLLPVCVQRVAHMGQKGADLLVGRVGRSRPNRLGHLLPGRLVGLPRLLVQRLPGLLVDLRLPFLAKLIFQHAQPHKALQHAVGQLLLLGGAQADARRFVELVTGVQGVLHRLHIVGHLADLHNPVGLLRQRGANRQQAAQQRDPSSFFHGCPSFRYCLLSSETLSFKKSIWLFK